MELTGIAQGLCLETSRSLFTVTCLVSLFGDLLRRSVGSLNPKCLPSQPGSTAHVSRSIQAR